jgi:hypothetical protein
MEAGKLQERINNAIFGFEIIKGELKDNLLRLIGILIALDLSDLQSLPASIHICEPGGRMYYIDFYSWSDSYSGIRISMDLDINYIIIQREHSNLFEIYATAQRNSISLSVKIRNSLSELNRYIEISSYKTSYFTSVPETGIDMIKLNILKIKKISAVCEELPVIIDDAIEKSLNENSFKFIFYAGTLIELIKILLDELSRYLKKI